MEDSGEFQAQYDPQRRNKQSTPQNEDEDGPANKSRPFIPQHERLAGY